MGYVSRRFGVSLHQRCILIIQITVYRFLLVSISIEVILSQATIRRRRKKLEEMARGDGFGDFYDYLINRIKKEGKRESKLGMDVLLWVLHSERPLHAEELCYALGVETGSDDQDLEGAHSLQTVLSSCQGLVIVEPSSSIVRPLHFSLRVSLLNHPTLFPTPHSMIAEICLTCLNFRSFWDLSPTPDSASPAIPFREYASCYWLKHARRGITENVETLAQRFLNRRATQFGLRLLD